MMSSDFPFKTTPYKHQLDCWDISKDAPAYAYFMEMGCLSGEAEIAVNFRGNTKRLTLQKLHEWWNGKNHHRDWQGPLGVSTRSYQNGSFRLNAITNVISSGKKQVLRIRLKSGKQLTLTPDHEVLTTGGWVIASELNHHYEVLTNVTKSEWDLLRLPIVSRPSPSCASCGNPKSTTSPKSRYYGWCRSCIMKHVSKNSDGRTIDKDGYIRIGGYRNHPRSNKSGQVLEHLIVMETKLGRPLLDHERVHHADENPKNNEPHNLELTTKNDHVEKHQWFRHLRLDVFTPVKDPVVDIVPAGCQETYDVSMLDPFRSFIANGIVVHNCGKSKVAIDTSAYLHLTKKIKGSVVVAPKGVYLNWVENEIPTHMSPAVPYRIAYWSSAAKKQERENLAKLYQDGDQHRILVVNIEAASSERAMDEVVKFMERYDCMMTVDESTTIKNPNAKRTKIMTNVGKFAKYRRIASGNPIPNGPLDLFSQGEFLRRGITGHSNYFSFRNRFAIMQDIRGGGGKTFKKVVGYRDVESLQAIMRRFSFIIKKDDCLDLPPKIYQVIDVEMGPLQTAAYNTMRDEACVILENLAMVTAPQAFTQLLRLHQISCGFLSPDGYPTQAFSEENDRLNTLLELLEQAEGKVIIWATYRFNIIQITAAIKAKFGADSVVEFWGDTSMDDRSDAKRKFQDPSSSVRFFVSNPATGKWGNTLTQATTVIYYSNSYDLESRAQSEDRAHRIGQTKPVLYIDLRVRGTVDDRIIRVLKEKKRLSDEIVASNWQWLIGNRVA